MNNLTNEQIAELISAAITEAVKPMLKAFSVLQSGDSKKDAGKANDAQLPMSYSEFLKMKKEQEKKNEVAPHILKFLGKLNKEDQPF